MIPVPADPPRLVHRANRWLSLLLGLEVLALALLLAALAAGRGRVCLVLSDSMAPTLRAGDLIWLRPLPPDQVRPGMIVSYWWDDKLITHRVLSLDGGMLHTGGDAAARPDPWTAPLSSLAGKPVLRIPWIGYLLLWMRRPAGWAVLVILPALLLVIALARGTLRLLHAPG